MFALHVHYTYAPQEDSTKTHLPALRHPGAHLHNEASAEYVQSEPGIHSPPHIGHHKYSWTYFSKFQTKTAFRLLWMTENCVLQNSLQRR
jgi:hypothetical protein